MSRLEITSLVDHFFTENDWKWIEESQSPPQLSKQHLQEYRKAYASCFQRDYEKSFKILEGLSGRYPQQGIISCLYIFVYLASGKEGCDAVLEKKLAQQQGSPVYFYLQGLLQESKHDSVAALACYQTAVKKQPDWFPALFRLAYLTDLRGDDERAIELYTRCTQLQPRYGHLWMNLGLLYEDKGDYHKAMDCYSQILAYEPHHSRAQLYFKDAQAALTMYVDEEKERETNKLNEILNTPISDFELSVRSKNCLNKMKIKTLGDLIKKSEAELLSYKNFGETSLAEIKGILEKKGLKLGMGAEDRVVGKKKEKKGIKATSTVTPPNYEVLGIPISSLDLSVRSRKCLNTMNIKTVGELIQKKESELLACRNFGQTSLAEIKRKLTDLGVTLLIDN